MNLAKRYFSTSIPPPGKLIKAAKQPVRVRYAPSPTGPLHIGGLRTALYNYLFAKKHNGKFILRIEDTDKTREVPGSLDNIVRGLKWGGLQWDEGPGSAEDTSFGPYFQSQRLHLYKKYAERLVENGDAYYCFCTPERLTQLRETQMKNKQVTKYDGLCQKLQDSEVYAKLNAGEKHVIRMRVPRGDIEVEDLIHGDVKFSNESIDDQVLLKSDGYPTYHLANVVDDHHMQISHVIRGEEWLTSLPKHVILYKALDFNIPKFAHLPLILNPTGGKLSKRHSHTTVDHYIEKEYRPEAVVNFVALLGWGPSKLDQLEERSFKNEILSMKEMTKTFELEDVVPSNAKLLESKLLYFNSFYLRKYYELTEKNQEEKIKEFKSYLCKYLGNVKQQIESTPESTIKEMMSVILDRIGTYDDLKNFSFFFELPDFNSEKSLKSKNKVMADPEKAKKIAVDTIEMLSKISAENFNQTNIAKVFGEYLYANRATINNESLYHLLRYAITGVHSGGPVIKICEVLGRDEILKRIKLLI